MCRWLLVWPKCMKLLGIIQGTIATLKFIFTASGEVKVKPKGLSNEITLRAGSSDPRVFKQIFIDEEYRFIEKFHAKTVIDAGANIGLASLYFRKVFPEAQIIALEPEDENYQLMCRNVRHDKKIICVKAALWKNNTWLKIDNPDQSSWAFTVSETSAEEGSIKAVTVPEVFSLLQTKEVDVFKLDIEGSEKELFEKSEGWEQQIKIYIVELHERLFPGSSQNFLERMSRLEMDHSIEGENVIYSRKP